LFAAGLVVYLRRETGEAKADGKGSAVTPPPAPDAAAVAPPAIDAAAPANMLLVRKADGSPWFYTDASPVTVASYRALFAKHDPAANPQDAVTNVSYTEAKSYVKTKGGRLLTAQEWERAAVTPNFTVRDGLLEWVSSPEEKKKTVRAHGKIDTRPDAKQKDVTFRMARDI
jgi:hypothetical protein